MTESDIQIQKDMAEEIAAKRELAVFRAENEKQKAAILKLDLEARKGSVIAVSDVKLAFGNIINELNGRLHALPRKLSAKLASINSVSDTQKLLTDTIIEMMEDVKGLDIDELAAKRGGDEAEKSVKAVGKSTQKGAKVRTK